MKKWLARCGWMALGIAGLYATAALSGVVAGGPLDPPGTPGSTMKTLEEIPGTWSRLLSDAGPDACNTARFTCVMNGDAVRDNETGLVWDRSPFTSVSNWAAAAAGCGSAAVGGRGGWRLPTDAEMRSLLDPNSTQQPLLPDNHPFNVFVAHGYVWTSTAVPLESDLAYAVDTDTLDRVPAAKMLQYKKWCVRGVQADAPEDSQLAEMPPAWYRTLDATGGCFSERFRCVMENDAAVLDRETGLVWQRSLSVPITMAWSSAHGECLSSVAGGRGGWRLPTSEEVGTLWTHYGQGLIQLPTGHPFNVASNTYVWTATSAPGDATQAFWRILGSTGGSLALKSAGYYVICVRGGQGYDGT